MTTPSLPNQFFVYFPQRKAVSDIYSGLVLLERDLTNPDPSALHIQYPPKSNDAYELKLHTSYSSFFGFYTLMGAADTFPPPMQSLLKQCKGIIIVKKGSTTAIPVFKINDISKRFTHILKRNVQIELAPTPQTSVLPTPQSSVLPTPQSSVLPTPQSSVLPTPPKHSSHSKKKTGSSGDLHPFVAKQLLEFVQFKKEMCPITAEEYITGETAVMPCGHLFMKFAITESFKKEAGRCPACRQSGFPTYV